MADKLIIFDTTLRDGEQSPGCSMYLEEKIKMARQLERLGVDVIEAGFPIASDGDFRAVGAVSEICRNSTVAGLPLPSSMVANTLSLFLSSLVTLAPVRILMPCFSNCFRANAAISASSTGRICGSTSTTVTSAPMVR